MVWLRATAPAVAAEVQGKVTDRATGKPIPTAVVTILEPERRVAAGPGGGFRLEGMPPGPRDIKVEAPGYVSLVVRDLPALDERPLILEIALRAGIATLPAQRVAADRPSRLAQTETSRRSITGEEVRHVAGARSDPILAIANTAGVKSGGFSGAPAVRGGGPGDNRYVIDGIEIGNPYHFGGLVSVFNAGTISRVDLYSGALPARYGNALSAVIDVETRDPRRDDLHGVLDANLLYSEALVEGPLGPSGAFSLAGRRSYVDLVVSPLVANYIQAGTVLPFFTDYQGKVTLGLPAGGRVDLVGIGSQDATKIVLAEGGVGRGFGDIALDTGYRSTGAVWRQPIGDALSNRFTANYQEPFTDFQVGKLINNEDFRFRWTLADEVAWQATEQHQLRSGLRFDTIDYVARRRQPDFSKLPRPPGGGGTGGPMGGRVSIGQGSGGAATASFPTPEEIAALPVRTTDTTGNQKVYAAYLEDAWAVRPDLTLSLGVRYDRLWSTADDSLAPRGGLSWRVDPETTFRLAYGQQYQFPGESQLLPGVGNPGLRAAFAKDYVIGFDRQIGERLFGRFEWYYRNLFGLVVPDERLIFANVGAGRSFGVESTLELAETAGWSGALALTVARAFRSRGGATEVPYEYDQPIVANILATAPAQWGWTPSLKLKYSAGRPYTPLVGRERDANGIWRGVPGETNSRNYPDGVTWSARVERPPRLFGLDDAFYLEVTQQAEALAPSYKEDYSNFDKPDFNYGLPPLPYLGYRIKF